VEKPECSENFSIEVEGENAVPTFKRISEFVEKSDDKGITRISIEIDSKEPLVMGDYIEDVFKTGNNEVNLDKEIINFSSDSEAFKVASFVLEECEEWTSTGDIKRGLSDSFPTDRTSQVLWDLSERGVLDKRPCSTDGRMKEYRITKMGKDSVEDVNE
jgi:hypothetical protein